MVYEVISFPKREWTQIKKVLHQTGKSSTVRCCLELGKYKKGQRFMTPWKDLIEIVSVKRYTKAESLPYWSQLDKGMKISVRFGERYGNSKWDHVVYKLLK